MRDGWASLDGTWEFAFDPAGRWNVPDEVQWSTTIEVPFAPETAASGIRDTGFHRVCWYRRRFDAPQLAPDGRLLLHFGAVDYGATVWVNGILAATHEGGYTPFHVDVTGLLLAGAAQTLVVRAEDDPQDLAKPRGKQDWMLEPHSIWYPRTSGIWQTVWLEPVPATYVSRLRWSSSLARWEIGIECSVSGALREPLRLGLRLSAGDTLLASDAYEVIAGEVIRHISLSDPGIDDYRNTFLWSPSCPTLIDAEIRLWGSRGELLDTVRSYTAMREVTVQGDRFTLNGRVLPLRLVLDQGYWPESGTTAPDDDALRRDVELTLAMGFNGVRKHQKIEDPRYLYWADRLGLLVWEEMPSAYRFTTRSITRLTREWMAVLERDVSHPCIVAWVPFNESWGVPDLPALAEQRHYVETLYHLTKTIDPSRPVIGNDGWESGSTDIIGIHDYDDDVERLARRYANTERLPQLFKHGRPGGRVLALEQHPHRGQPIVLTEFGGVALSGDRTGTWGYSRCEDAPEFERRYAQLLDVVRRSEMLAGFCYTQFADTYQECNGLLRADRSPKIPLETLAAATRGPSGRR